MIMRKNSPQSIDEQLGTQRADRVRVLTREAGTPSKSSRGDSDAGYAGRSADNALALWTVLRPWF